ncbi:hypothetical protein [Halobellus limi]|uniref:DUF7969 domain-containing protein n=1 Tax=Halobellus limi TaxID=699433 RepID=A0A1H5U9Z7_9EURY|nr:hypothetical protein [Halobellus limi]QCC47098.1 hypothetical protein DV707_05115 [Halobellus limi]SEF71844.1 hypothetical protein SAMN04488133_0528 [Halobellus limi]
MSYPVRYYCPHCGAVFELEREGYLSDKSVTPYPLVGWEYAAPDEDFESADGVRLVCGEDVAGGEGSDGGERNDGGEEGTGDVVRWTGERSSADDVEDPTRESPCGETLFLSFVRFVDGEEVEPEPERAHTTIATDGPGGPRGTAGPRGPSGPSGFGQ